MSFLALACIALSSCVTKKQYQALEASKTEMESSLKRKNDDCVEKNAALVASIAQLEAEKGEKQKHISALKDTIETCQVQLDENLQYIRNLGSSLDAQRQNLAQEINEKNKTLATKELELNTALAKAEAERARIDAENARSEALAALELEKARLAAMPRIIEQMVKPAEKIDKISINHITGLGSRGNGASGEQGAASPVSQIVDSILEMSVAMPALNKLGEMIGNGIDGRDEKAGGARK